MLWSMTGFGKSETIYEKKKISIEIKSLNSKQLDFSARLPFSYNEKELDIRNIINSRLERGKITFNLYCESVGDKSLYKINKDLAVSYFNELKDIRNLVHENHESDLIGTVMRLPDVVTQNRDILPEGEWFATEKAVILAIDMLEAFRIQEGELLKIDFIRRINVILALLKSVDPFEKLRIERIKERILKELNQYSEDINIDRNRFEQELIFYIEKLDITEEKLRLEQHCNYFLKTISDKEMSKGKKLGFILQEIGREINTLGSKANDTDIQKIVVDMKDELEKIKEQSLNIL